MTYADRLYDAWAGWIADEEPGAGTVEDAVRRDAHAAGFYLAVGVRAVREAPHEPYPDTLTEDHLWSTCAACQHHRRWTDEHHDGDPYRSSAGLFRGDLCSDHRNRRAGHRMRAESTHALTVSVVLARMLRVADFDGDIEQDAARIVLDRALTREATDAAR